jgi:hypothetical protein
MNVMLGVSRRFCFALIAVAASLVLTALGGREAKPISADEPTDVESVNLEPAESEPVTFEPVGWQPLAFEQETRTFRASVDGRERGQLVMSFVQNDDGTETVSGETELNFNFIVYRYRYASVGTETWKDGRLIRLASESSYNGDKYVLQATATQDLLEYEVNGAAQKTTTEGLITTHWREPSADKVGRQLTLLDADKGQQRATTLEKVGTEKLIIAEVEINATHYRLRGEVVVDVWYDQFRRMVRQESMESGHRVVLELMKTER